MSVKNFKVGDSFKIAVKTKTIEVKEIRETPQGRKIVCKVSGKTVIYTPEKLNSLLA